jgi:alkylation response protein AidB-like acyl-CoA dehydrogenase
MRALQMADVILDGVRVAGEQRLPGGARRIIDASRVALAAILSGLARAVYDYALPYVKERVVHGEAIGRKQAIAFKLADMHVATNAMRWMSLRAAAELDSKPEATRMARLAQRYAAELALKIADEGVQLFGGYGFVRDYPLEMWYRNARSLSTLDGLVGA